jgi:hypothetical protein
MCVDPDATHRLRRLRSGLCASDLGAALDDVPEGKEEFMQKNPAFCKK